MTNGKMCACGTGCGCMHHKATPVLIVLIGLTFLLGALDVLSVGFVAKAWPTLLIILGVMKLCGGMCRCCGPEAMKK